MDHAAGNLDSGFDGLVKVFILGLLIPIFFSGIYRGHSSFLYFRGFTGDGKRHHILPYS